MLNKYYMDKYKNAEPPDEQDLADYGTDINKCAVNIKSTVYKLDANSDLAA